MPEQHAHKRRLQESYEMRRLKRQSEGKSVALPRKPQVGWQSLFGLPRSTRFHALNMYTYQYH